MNDDFKARQRFWLWVAEYYGHQFTENQLVMFSEDVLECSPMELKRAFIAYRRDPSNTYSGMPRPAILINYISPQISHRALADDASSRIFQAIKDYGYLNSLNAQKFIGELGWKVVEREGGWHKVCETTMEKTKSITKAQWRDLALSLLERAKHGQIDVPPMLPRPNTKKISELYFDQFPALILGGKKNTEKKA